MNASNYKIAAQPDGRDARYAGFFDCFNRQRYFEAHEVLEPLWLERRGRPDAAFYKGLIQIAGAFVHLQKNRLNPASRLFRLALENLRPFAPQHEGLDMAQLLRLIASCLDKIESHGAPKNPYDAAHPPTLKLEAA
ncbi:MAG: DUF309 domain-containing protein [Verrucomicrobia bacterium]|nr:DUF309 domain-containing protein [Verrucomicrobiota bacterium]